MTKKIIDVANKANRIAIEGLQNFRKTPIEYDGMVCPECHANTVSCMGYVWCPDIGCSWGNELKLPKLITKWATNLD